MTRRAIACATLAFALGAGCSAKPPDDGGGGGPLIDAGPAFADTVMSFAVAGEAPTSCSDALPVCGETDATCGPLEVLGAPDAVTYALEPGGVIEVALLCSAILERGAGAEGEASLDLKVWATLPTEGLAVVSVSFDGSEWFELDDVEGSDPALDLARVDLTVVRFVRIANQGAGTIALDAVGAFDG